MPQIDDASLWFQSQGAQIQDYAVPESPLPEEGFDTNVEQIEEPEVTQHDAETRLAKITMNEPIARTIVGLMDIIVPLLLLFLIRGADKEDMKLSEDEQETLVGAWAQFLGGREVEMSPGAALIISIVTIYGAKVFVAAQHAKERRETNLLYQQVADLRSENQALRQQLGEESGD